jgi:hypothetical protein
MNGLTGGRTASDMPGLDIAEQKSRQNFLGAASRLYAAEPADLADPSLETQDLVERGASPEDRRGVVATITDKGRTLAEQALVTYA